MMIVKFPSGIDFEGAAQIVEKIGGIRGVFFYEVSSSPDVGHLTVIFADGKLGISEEIAGLTFFTAAERFAGNIIQFNTPVLLD